MYARFSPAGFVTSGTVNGSAPGVVLYERLVLMEPCTEATLLEQLQVDIELNPLRSTDEEGVAMAGLTKSLKAQWARIAREEEIRGLTRGFVMLREPVDVGDEAEAPTRLVGIVDAWNGRVLAIAADCELYDAGLKLGYKVVAIDGHPVTRDMISAISHVRMAASLGEQDEESARDKKLRLTVEHHDTEVRGDMLVVKIRVSCGAGRSANLRTTATSMPPSAGRRDSISNEET